MGVKTTAKKGLTTKKALASKKLPAKKARVASNRSGARGSMVAGVGNRIASKGWSMDDVVRVLTNSIEKTNASLEKTNAIIAETDARLDARIKELARTQEESFRNMEKTNREFKESLDKRTRELNESLDKRTRELNESLDRTTQRLSDSIDKLNNRVGGMSNSIGRIVELVVLPGLIQKMNELTGYGFVSVSANRQFWDKNNNGLLYAEVDQFLENGSSVMVVEAKTRVKEDHIDELLEKLQKIRAHEDSAGLVGKTIYAGIAGITFDAGARKAAEKNGIYIICLDQNNEKIKVEPLSRDAGTW